MNTVGKLICENVRSIYLSSFFVSFFLGLTLATVSNTAWKERDKTLKRHIFKQLKAGKEYQYKWYNSYEIETPIRMSVMV